jgi:hypothetical protein
MISYTGLETVAGLETLYEAYRRRQALSLLGLIPREAIRPLYREAGRWASGCGIRDWADPMAILTAYCMDLLPLPTFEVWLSDLRRNPGEHLREREAAPPGASPSQPVKTDVRRVVHQNRSWVAGLHVFRDQDTWRGFVAFQSEEGPTLLRTADIFREDRAEAIRRRFDELDPSTLQAFLRSVLP